MAKRIVKIKEIPGHPDYFADVYGGIWSARGAIVWRLSATRLGRYGYVGVSLGFRKRHAVQHLIALTFLGPRPRRALVLHGDDDPRNNRLDNLSYGTHQENQAQAWKRGRHPRGEYRSGSKLTAKIVRSIRAKHATGTTMAELGRTHGVSSVTILKIVRRERWKHV